MVLKVGISFLHHWLGAKFSSHLATRPPEVCDHQDRDAGFCCPGYLMILFWELTECVTPPKVSSLKLNPGYGLVPRSEENIKLIIHVLKGWLKCNLLALEFCWILRWLSPKKTANHLVCIFLFGRRERLSPGGTYDLPLFGCQDLFAVSSTQTTDFLRLHLLQETDGYIRFVYLHDCKSIFLYAYINT